MITHKSAKIVAEFCTLHGFATTYVEFKRQVELIASDGKNKELHGDFVEVFVECFVRYFGEHPLFIERNRNRSIKDVEDTSQLDLDENGRSKHPGLDFYAKDEHGARLGLQVKGWLHATQIENSDLNTFELKCFREHIQNDGAYFIVPFLEAKNKNLFHFSVETSAFITLGREVFQACLDRCPEFWKRWKEDLEVILLSSEVENERVTLKLWPHQQCAYNAVNASTGHVRIQIPTGGGKTALVAELMKADHKVQVMVAPYIVLVRQNDDAFTKFGMYDDDNVINLHVRSGDRSKTCKIQTTLSEEIAHNITLSLSKSERIIINATYKSLERVLHALKSINVKADRIYCDECHMLCSPDTLAQKKYIEEIQTACERMISLSASEKNGRFVKAHHLGELISKISYYELQQPSTGDNGNPALVGGEKTFHLCILRSKKRTPRVSNDDRYNAALQHIDLNRASISDVAIKAFTMHVKNQRDGYVKMIVADTSCDQIRELHNNLSDFSKETGIAINAVYSGKHDCTRQLEEFKNSFNGVLLQYKMASIGFDHKPVNSLLLNRRVNDETLLQQFVGRILRYYKGKTEVYVGINTLGDDDEQFVEYFKTVYNTLIACGIPRANMIVDEVDERMSTRSPEDGLIASIECDVKLDDDLQRERVENVTIDYEEVMDCQDEQRRLDELDNISKKRLHEIFKLSTLGEI